MNASTEMALGDCGGGDQHVLDYLRHMKLEDPSFYYAIQSGRAHSNANVFWATSCCRTNYSYFGDTVTFDTSYSARGYQVPFVSLTGINHHGQPVLFGCGLLYDESAPSYVWLLQNWLDSVSGHQPMSITTEPDRYIEIACSQVLPQSYHCYSKWSIFRVTKENLSSVYQSYPGFETEFMKCVNESETVEEFESQWMMLLGRYYLMENEWLQTMYRARNHWVPVYLRGTFFGVLPLVDDNNARSSYFDEFIDSNATIPVLIKQFEKAIASWHGKELMANEDTANTIHVPKTPSPMEKQAADVYTRFVFTKFQEELLETMANLATWIEESGSVTSFRVTKFGEDHHKGHIVNFDSGAGIKASCSCQMFEFCGIVCRHILSVFREKNVLALPSDYVLKRWTRNAKDDEDQVDGQMSPLGPNQYSRENLSFRQSSLREEALKFVEEGAKSMHGFHVAMEALRVASSRVAAAKSAARFIDSSSSLWSGNNVNLGDGENQALPGNYMEEKAKKIHELSEELERTNRRCEAYKSNLLNVLKCVEDEKLKLSVTVQNARLTLKE